MQEQDLRTQAKPEKAAPREWVFLIALGIWGYFFAAHPPLFPVGIGLALQGVSIVAVCYAYLRALGKKPANASYLAMGFMVLLSASFAFFENSDLCAPLFLLMFPAFAFWLSHAGRPRALAEEDAREVFLLLMASPFQGLREKFSPFAAGNHSRKRLKNILIGVAATLPVLAIATSLLMDADRQFSALLISFGDRFFERIGTVAVRALLGCVVGAYLFSMTRGVLREREAVEQKPRPRFSLTVLGIMVSALCALYIVFLLVQIPTLCGALAARNPDASFYSDYARDGFFQLCLVALLNLAVFLGAQYFRGERRQSLSVLLTALAGLTQLIIVTTILKMGLYMSVYGLTLLRVQTMWIMSTLMIVFGLLMAAQWTRISALKGIVAVCAASVLLAAYANIGGLVARVNVDRYLAGTLARFDVSPYGGFRYEALPELIRLHENVGDGQAPLKGDLERFLLGGETGGDGSVLYKSVQRLTAEARLEAFREAMGSADAPSGQGESRE